MDPLKVQKMMPQQHYLCQIYTWEIGMCSSCTRATPTRQGCFPVSLLVGEWQKTPARWVYCHEQAVGGCRALDPCGDALENQSTQRKSKTDKKFIQILFHQPCILSFHSSSVNQSKLSRSPRKRSFTPLQSVRGANP